MFAGQPKRSGPPGKTPAATTIVPAYDIPGQRLVRSIMYPIIPTAELPMMNGALRFVLSAHTAMYIVVQKAMKFGGIVSNCACAEL